MILPRLLVIDDLLGSSDGSANRDRNAFCFRAGLADVTGDVAPDEVPAPCAEAVFLSGQRVERGRIVNDRSEVLKGIQLGFLSPPRWPLVLLDLHFATGPIVKGKVRGVPSDRAPHNYFGLEILRAIRSDARLDDLAVVMLSSMDRSEVEPIFTGLDALDFCDKSTLDRGRLNKLLNEHGLLEDETVIGGSLPLLKGLRKARRRARHGNDNILVVGETGTGKELVASYIHRWSGRSGQYVPLFTQGVPESLIEDRLFGHEKGAFAGAESPMPGAAEQANGGTLFIDEFNEIPQSTQTKLLRLLDVNIRECQRLGSREPQQLDLQVVLATSHFDARVQSDLRTDLIHRIKADDPIEVPPLRDRREDIPRLAEAFLRKFEARFEAERRTLPVETVEILQSRDWPGNVRQLERVVERAVLHYRGLRVLAPRHLDAFLNTHFLRTPSSVVRPSLAPVVAPRSGQLQTGDSAQLYQILALLDEYPFDALNGAALAGALPRARKTMASCLANLLRRALVLTSRPTADTPEGELRYTPAVHLLLGLRDAEKKDWKSPRCADLVRWIAVQAGADQEGVGPDPVLQAAYSAASRLRRRKRTPPK